MNTSLLRIDLLASLRRKHENPTSLLILKIQMPSTMSNRSLKLASMNQYSDSSTSSNGMSLAQKRTHGNTQKTLSGAVTKSVTSIDATQVHLAPLQPLPKSYASDCLSTSRKYQQSNVALNGRPSTCDRDARLEQGGYVMPQMLFRRSADLLGHSGQCSASFHTRFQLLPHIEH